ncbi:MAG: cadmium-translocating P-type ATPase [Clostridia bacterium]|nr:cadmium-translocating P-type ATPase [Clostridia bacterium]
MKSVLRLRGLDCAHCAAELEEKISALDGVQSAVVSFVNGLLTVEYDGEETLEKIIAETNAFEEVRVVEETENADAGKKRRFQWLLIALSALFFVGGGLLERFAVGAVAHYICYALAYFAVGYPVLINTGKNIVKGNIFDENFLMTVASIGAALLGEWSESVLVMLLYQIGETLQGMAVDSSRRSITRLMDLKSEWATVLDECDCGACHEHAQKQVRPEALKIGDTVLVKAGEKVPVDGVLLDETASLDTKSLTGESELRQVKAGEELLSGCINAGNAFKMRVVREYENSAVSKILDLVENASSGKAKPEKFITKFARYYTPIVCVAALLLAFAVPFIDGLVSGGDILFKDFPRWSKSALTFLVVSCPCALIISVPLTYFSGIGACAKKGILVKGATYLDEVARAKIFAFDKTGTLTEGNFTVCEVREQGVSKEELLYLVAAVERASSHPIAKAFENVPTPYVAQEVREFAGRGLSGVIDGKTVLIGSVRLLRENKVFAIEERSPYTLIYIAREDTYLGCIAVGDKLREEAKEALSQLRNAGAERLVILTGDTPERAQKIAYEAGVSEVKASLLPDEKLREANEYKKEGGFVYVGDGVNDAPVMAVADCGVSMGKLGSAAAVEASDLVLISDNLSALPKCVKIAKKTRAVALQNIVFSIVMKVAFMTLGALGVLPLGLAVFADVGVMLLAVLNALRVS